jgi:hypothetical protein
MLLALAQANDGNHFIMAPSCGLSLECRGDKCKNNAKGPLAYVADSPIHCFMGFLFFSAGPLFYFYGSKPRIFVTLFFLLCENKKKKKTTNKRKLGSTNFA